MSMQPPSKMIGVFGIVALTFATAPRSSAQEIWSDTTVCRGAIKSDRSGWVKGSSYADEASKRGLTFCACDEMNNPPAKDQTPDDYHPSFLQAGIFFMTGFEPPDIKIRSPNSAVGTGQVGLYPFEKMYTGPNWYQLQADKPCTIFVYKLAPPYGVVRLEFDNLPSPRAATYDYVQGPGGRTDLVVSI